jgi:hypothetical protein
MTLYKIILRTTGEVFLETKSLFTLEYAEQTLVNQNIDYFVVS